MSDRTGSSRIIAFLSGKGGAGKTTSAIAVAKLLADTGHGVLLIDLDLATNGASYFFRTKTTEAEGFIDALESSESSESIAVSKLIVEIGPRFDFVPSRTVFQRPVKSMDSRYIKEAVSSSLSKIARHLSYEYIILDCGAGYSPAAEAASQASETAVFVAEPDAISNDAADALLAQLRFVLPDRRLYLVNKIDIRDPETYAVMRDVFKTLNRLPPLPFDFAVRDAFGNRRIPLDVNKPSALLFALLETCRVLFPELSDDFELYREKHATSLLQQYDKQVEDAVNEKERLESLLAKTSAQYRASRLGSLLLVPIVSVIAVVGVVLAATFHGSGTLITSAVAALVTSLLGLEFVAFANPRSSGDEGERAALEQRLNVLNRQLDNYRSLLIARSKEFLLDLEISGQLRTSTDPRAE